MHHENTPVRSIKQAPLTAIKVPSKPDHATEGIKQWKKLYSSTHLTE